MNLFCIGDFVQPTQSQFKDKLTSSLYWWLSKNRPFIINDEYKLELLFVDTINYSAKIRVTNLKTGEINTLGDKNE